MLVVYGMELGGSYARDPMGSYGGDCDFRLDAVTSPERLQAWFDQVRYFKELALAQATAKRVLAGFASPEGSAHAILLDSHQAWEAPMWGYHFSITSSFPESRA